MAEVSTHDFGEASRTDVHIVQLNNGAEVFSTKAAEQIMADAELAKELINDVRLQGTLDVNKILADAGIVLTKGENVVVINRELDTFDS